MVDRIKQVMDYEQMSPTAFADKINVNRSSLTHIFSGRNQPSLDIAKKILIAFPEISTEWLIMGMGEMLQPVAAEPEKPITKTVDNMQQTDLFSGTEDAYVEPTPEVQDEQPVEETPVPPPEEEPVTKPTSKEVEKDSPTEEPVEEPAVTVPEPQPKNEIVTRPNRGRSRVSDSRISVASQRRERISNSQDDKKMVKIVFFYEDRSFEEYYPR